MDFDKLRSAFQGGKLGLDYTVSESLLNAAVTVFENELHDEVEALLYLDDDEIEDCTGIPIRSLTDEITPRDFALMLRNLVVLQGVRISVTPAFTANVDKIERLIVSREKQPGVVVGERDGAYLVELQELGMLGIVTDVDEGLEIGQAYEFLLESYNQRNRQVTLSRVV